jgi:hypothetical protein
MVSAEVADRTGGNSIWNSGPISVPGGFTRELIFLGGSHYGVGDWTGYNGCDPYAIAEADIDNVIIPEPATILLLGLGGLALLRKRRK